jgi:hypothetical protein
MDWSASFQKSILQSSIPELNFVFKNIDFLGHLWKTDVKHSKYRKVGKFWTEFGPQKFVSGSQVGISLLVSNFLD